MAGQQTIYLEPLSFGGNKKSQLKTLKRFMQRQGIRTELEVLPPKPGQMGRGVAGALATVLAGGESFFSRLGEAIVKYVENKRTDLTVRNANGEEITLSSAMQHEHIRMILNEFFQREIAPVDAKKERKRRLIPSSKTKKSNSAKTSTKKTKTSASSTSKSVKKPSVKTTVSKSSVRKKV